MKFLSFYAIFEKFLGILVIFVIISGTVVTIEMAEEDPAAAVVLEGE